MAGWDDFSLCWQEKNTAGKGSELKKQALEGQLVLGPEKKLISSESSYPLSSAFEKWDVCSISVVMKKCLKIVACDAMFHRRQISVVFSAVEFVMHI
jgi:hypothetical protein